MDNRISLLKTLRPDIPVGRFQLGGLIKAVDERKNLEAIRDELVQIAGGISGGGENDSLVAAVVGLIVLILAGTGYWKIRQVNEHAHRRGNPFFDGAENFIEFTDESFSNMGGYHPAYGGQRLLPQAINFAIVIVIAIIFIFIGGSCLYMHNKTDDAKKNPLYFALGIAFAGAGGSIISHAAMGVMIPPVIRSMIQNTKANGRI